MNNIFSSILLLISLMFSGCATLFGGGGHQHIYINGNTDKNMKAVVRYSDGSGIKHVSIPGKVLVDRKEQDIVIESTGNEFDTYIVASELNPYFVPNFLGSLFGFISTTVDSSSGAMWVYDEAVIVNEKY